VGGGGGEVQVMSHDGHFSVGKIWRVPDSGIQNILHYVFFALCISTQENCDCTTVCMCHI
jgi:hypothetical protein